MKFKVPEPEIRGTGRITNPKTGEVLHFWLGKHVIRGTGAIALPGPAADQSPKPKGEVNADPVNRGS